MAEATATTATETLPLLGAAAVGGASLLLNAPLNQMGRSLFSGIKWVLTANGHLNDIPVVGGVFSGIGAATDTLGDVSGYLLGGAASILTFKMLQSTPATALPATPETGTGRTGAVTPTLPLQAGAVKINAPAGIPASPAAPQAKLPESLNPNDITGLTRTAQEAFTQQNAGLLKIVNEWRGYHNQRYEDRVFAAHSFLRFNGMRPTDAPLTQEQQHLMANYAKRLADAGTPIAMNSRNTIITELTKTGLTRTEATSLIPEAPRLPLTPPTEPGADDLAEFARLFQKTYGTNQVEVTQTTFKGDKPTGTAKASLAYDDMSLTQKREFIAAAIDYTRGRYIDIVNTTSVDRSDTDFTPHTYYSKKTDWPAVGENLELNFMDRKGGNYFGYGATYSDKMHQHTNTSGTPTKRMKLADEYEFLKIANSDPKSKSFRSDLEIGDGLPKLTESFARFSAHIDDHQLTLRNLSEGINTQVSQYEREIRLTQSRLSLLRDHKLAFVSSLKEQAAATEGNHTVAVVDLRGTKPERLNLTGTFSGDTFKVTAVTTETGRFIDLTGGIPIDMANPETGIAQLRKRLDAPLGRLSSLVIPAATRFASADVATPFTDSFVPMIGMGGALPTGTAQAA